MRVIFFRWDLKTSCIKNSEYESQTKKMVSVVSHFWSPTLTTLVSTLVVCICILIFHVIYSSLPPHRPEACNFKRRLWHRCFPVNFVKFLRTFFLQKHLDDCFCLKMCWLLFSSNSQKVYCLIGILFDIKSVWFKIFESFFIIFWSFGWFWLKNNLVYIWFSRSLSSLNILIFYLF